MNAKNKITAVGSLADPVLRYGFAVTNWRLDEVRKTDRKTREIVTIYKINQNKADTYRLYVERKGGRGLLQIEVTYKAEIINIAEHLNTKYKEDQFVNILKSHESNKPNMN
jgi:hypothetical protein